MPDLLENWPQEFSQHEHVEVRVDADKIYSTGQHAMRCTNGIVLHTDPDKNVYEVLDLDAESSQASMLKVHSQVRMSRSIGGGGAGARVRTWRKGLRAQLRACQNIFTLSGVRVKFNFMFCLFACGM